MKTLILLALSIGSLNAQYYSINKEKSKSAIDASDSLSSSEKYIMQSRVAMKDMIIFLDNDSFHVASAGFYPLIESDLKTELFKYATLSENGFIMEMMHFEKNNEVEDSIQFAEIKQAVLDRNLTRRKKWEVTESVIVFESLIKKYQNVSAGEILTDTFRFVNKSSKILKIESVKSDCGCTIPDWPNNPIEPGNSSFIITTYDTKNKPSGKSTRRIKVAHNFYDEPIVLKIEAHINNPEKPEIAVLKNYNNMFAGDTLTQNELLERKQEHDNLQNDIKRIGEFFGVDQEIEIVKFEELTEIDTINTNKFVLKTNWTKYIELQDKLEKMKKEKD